MRTVLARATCVLFVACVATVAASVGACADLGGLAGGDDVTNAPTPQGEGGADNPCQKDLDGDHDNCGACGTVCGAVEHCLAAKCAPGCPDHVVYVSADGNDNASGCTTTTPKRTVGAAIALLKTLSAQKHEIHVCRGQYEESVLLDYPASLLGGYECSTWMRSTAYGAPTFDGINESVVQGTAAAPPLTVVKVEGALIDGITFRARDTATGRSAAALLTDGAKVKFANAKLLGGGGEENASPASAGLVVDSGSFGEVTSCTVDGGNAVNSGTAGYGSAGIFVTSKGGGVHVLQSRVSGGGGIVSSGTGSVGILALGATLASTIDTSDVNGGTGRTNNVGSSSYGIGFFSSSTADVAITGSTITGGAGTCGKACSVTGVAVTAKGKVQVAGNRISGGEVKTDLFDDASFSGLRLSDYASADIQNNLVFSGNIEKRFTSAATVLGLTRGGVTLVANNSLTLGPSRVDVGSVVVGTANATFANNLFFDAASTATAVAVELDACSGRTYALQNNAWVGFPNGAGLLRFPRGAGACPPASTPPVHTTVDALEADAAAVFGAAKVGGNARLSDACGPGEPRCSAPAACVTPSGCIGAVLGGVWDPKTAGGLLTTGWKLKDGVACSISKGGLAVPGLLTKDGFGVARTPPFSLGASEHDGTCN